MSITLRSDQINFIVYKYLLEVGLNHTAFNMYFQAGLENTSKQYKYDIQAGHLITYLERGLILTQIEAHVYLNEYQQCKQPIHLLKPHTCIVSQKVKQLKNTIINQMNENIYESIKRTNDIRDNLLKQKFTRIEAEIKTSDILEKLEKLRLKNKVNSNSIYYCAQLKSLAINQQQEHRMTYIQYNQQYQSNPFEVNCIIPTLFKDSFYRVIGHLQTSQNVILVFEQNNIMILDSDYTVINMFQLDHNEKLKSIEEHKTYPNLICFSFQSILFVLNLTTMKIIVKHEPGYFCWRYHDQYIYSDGIKLQHRSLNGMLINGFLVDDQISNISLSHNKDYLLVESKNSNKIKIYTFLKSQPLLVFEQETPIQKTLWVVSKRVNYLIILTETELKIWDMELSGIKWQVKLTEPFINFVSATQEDQQQGKSYLIGLNQNTINIYDVSDTRQECITLKDEAEDKESDQNSKEYELKQISEKQSILITNSGIIMLNPIQIKKMFE